MKTSLEIAENMNVPHSELMDFYTHLSDKIAKPSCRKFIKCLFVFCDEGNYLRNVCESLEFAFYVHFNKVSSLNTLPFHVVEVDSVSR
jgi:hypothetical protein